MNNPFNVRLESTANPETVAGVPVNEITSLWSGQGEIDLVKSLLLIGQEETEREGRLGVRQAPSSLVALLKKIRLMLTYGIHWNKPFFPLRIVRNMLIGRFYQICSLDHHVFKGCEFDLTFACNFSCTHCSTGRLEQEVRSREEHLEPRDYTRISNQAMDLGATAFGFIGGEPFVKKNWDEIMAKCKPRYNHILATTNGWLFDEKRAKRCVEIGLDTINLSLDNGIPELHDLFRKKVGSYERVVKAVKLCKAHNIKPVLQTVVHKKNLYTQGFIDVLELAESEGVLLHCCFAKNIGNFKEADNVMLEEKDFKAWAEIVEPYTSVYVHHETERKMNWGNFGRSGCRGTKEVVNVSPYGEVMNCANMHIYFGDLKSESLGDIRARAIRQMPTGKYGECFVTRDDDFMNIYYPLLEDKVHATIAEFHEALSSYEKETQRSVYPGLERAEQEQGKSESAPTAQ